MEESSQLEKISSTIDELSKKVDVIATAISEEANAYSIYSKAKDSFKNWVGMWIGFLVLFFAAIGYTSYQQAVEKLSNSTIVIDRLTKDISPKVQEAVLKNSEQQILEQIQRNDAVLDEQLANIRADAEERISILTTQFNEKLATISRKTATEIKPIQVEKKLVDTGYAFYGIRDGSTWRSRYFKVIGDAPSEPPKPGDTIEATSNVNIRSDYITFGISGWTNAPTLGVIVPGDGMVVTEVKQVVNGYFWIRFKNRSHN